MAISDSVGDMLTRIRNAQMRKKASLRSPASKMRARVLDILVNEGYIRQYSEHDIGSGRRELEIELKYYDGEPVIHELKRISKPGRRIYACASDIPSSAGGLGVTIVSTSRGVMSDSDARNNNVGGELICSVF